MGLETMKAWGVVNKDFPKPNINAFMTSEDAMNSIRLRIASIEKTILNKSSNNPDTENSMDPANNIEQPNSENPDIT